MKRRLVLLFVCLTFLGAGAWGEDGTKKVRLPSMVYRPEKESESPPEYFMYTLELPWKCCCREEPQTEPRRVGYRLFDPSGKILWYQGEDDFSDDGMQPQLQRRTVWYITDETSLSQVASAPKVSTSLNPFCPVASEEIVSAQSYRRCNGSSEHVRWPSISYTREKYQVVQGNVEGHTRKDICDDVCAHEWHGDEVRLSRCVCRTNYELSNIDALPKEVVIKFSGLDPLGDFDDGAVDNSYVYNNPEFSFTSQSALDRWLEAPGHGIQCSNVGVSVGKTDKCGAVTYAEKWHCQVKVGHFTWKDASGTQHTGNVYWHAFFTVERDVCGYVCQAEPAEEKPHKECNTYTVNDNSVCTNFDISHPDCYIVGTVTKEKCYEVLPDGQRQFLYDRVVNINCREKCNPNPTPSSCRAGFVFDTFYYKPGYEASVSWESVQAAECYLKNENTGETRKVNTSGRYSFDTSSVNPQEYKFRITCYTGPDRSGATCQDTAMVKPREGGGGGGGGCSMVTCTWTIHIRDARGFGLGGRAHLNQRITVWWLVPGADECTVSYWHNGITRTIREGAGANDSITGLTKNIFRDGTGSYTVNVNCYDYDAHGRICARCSGWKSIEVVP